MKKTLLFMGTSTLIAASPIYGAVVWTGAVDNDLFNDGNWDFSGAVNGTSAIDPNVAINEDLEITGATVNGATGIGFGQIIIGDNHSLTLTNSNLTMAGTDGIAGVDDGPGTARTNASVLNLVNSSADLQFASIGMDINVDATSSLNFRGGGDPLNGQTELSRAVLAPGGQLTFPTVAEFTEQATTQSSLIIVDGVQADGVNMNTLFSFSGSTGTALSQVPEPSSTALLGLSGLALILRRRK